MDAASIQLRAPRADDVGPYAGHLADAEVSRWLDDACQRPLTLVQVEAFMFQDLWCRWSIECDGAFIGLTGLEWNRTHSGAARFFVVIGRRDLWGRGIGTSVLRRVVDHGFRKLGLHRIASDYLAPNVASAAIHRHAGFVEEGRLRADAWRDGRWVDRILVSMLRDEYLERPSATMRDDAGAGPPVAIDAVK